MQKQPSVHLQINEYAKCGILSYNWNLFSLIKKEILTQATINELWVHYILSEINQPQKDMCHFTYMKYLEQLNSQR